MRIPPPGSVAVNVAGRWLLTIEPDGAGAAQLVIEVAAANPWIQGPPIAVVPLDRQEARSLGEALVRMADRDP